MKIAILGATHWHASCYYGPCRQLGHEIHLFDDDAAGVRARGEAKGFAWHAGYDDLACLRPDFAFCLGRHDQMAGLVALCIDHRLAFMAEKPGAPDGPTMHAFARRCDELGLFNASPFCYRWDNVVRHVGELLAGGRLGRVARIQAAYLGGAASRYIGWGCPWVLEKEKALGGSIYNEAVHAIDLLHCWGFRLVYRAGQASYAINRGEVDDMLTMVADCGEGYALIESGYLVQNPYGGLSFSLFCERANLDYRDFTLSLVWADGRRETIASAAPDPRAGMLDDLFVRLHDGRPAPSTLHDMAAVLDFCDAFNADTTARHRPDAVPPGES